MPEPVSCSPECGGRPSDGPPCRNCGKPVRHIYDDYYGCGCQGGGVKEGKKTNSLWLYLDKWYDVTDGHDNLPPEWKAVMEEDEKDEEEIIPKVNATKKKWYLFHKSFQGGAHDEWRLLDHKPKEEDMEYWGEHTGGGHNYGYRVTVEKGTPPREAIVKKIEKVRQHIERIKKSHELEDCQEEIAELEQYLGPEGAK